MLLQVLEPSDEILIKEMKHHANIVPWHFVVQRTGAKQVVAPARPDGSLDMDAFKARVNPRTKIVSEVHVSNAVGTLKPVHENGVLARSERATIVVDAAQSAPHMR